MSSPILIPSRERTRLFGTQGSTIHQFDEELRKRTYYFVEPIEYAKYFPHAQEMGFNLVPISSTGMGNLRWQMALWAEENGHTEFFMFDDDIAFFRRAGSDKTNLIRCTEPEIHEMLGVAEVTLTIDHVACVGISAREGNNHAGVGGPTLMVPNTRIIRAFMFKTQPFLGMEHGRVLYMEDFDVLLQLLEHGWENRSLFYWAQDQRGTQAAGGCSEHRTHERHERSAIMLQQLHPSVVTLREKRNKTGGEFGTRKEVTIQWKRALRKLPAGEG